MLFARDRAVADATAGEPHPFSRGTMRTLLVPSLPALRRILPQGSTAQVGQILRRSMLAVLVVASTGCEQAPSAERPAATAAPVIASRPAASAAVRSDGFLYGRVTTSDATYEGRLRWGGDQEAFWSDLFDGVKADNRWAGFDPALSAEGERTTIQVFGFEFGGPDRSHLQRRFLSRFGDIARIVTHFARVDLTLKSGTAVSLDRFAAGDIDDGVRVWDRRQGTVNLDTKQIQTIEFLPTPPLGDVPGRLHGVVRTRQGDFTGFLQWNQHDGVSSDTLDGRANDANVSLPYDTIRSIARHSPDSAMVTLHDGRELVLTGTSEAGRQHRGIYVDDLRYGRVLIAWNAFERVDFSDNGSGPAYAAFPPGRTLAGTVTARDGRQLTGRLVYDFDESETTDTLDVPSNGVDFAFPFGAITSIVPAGRDGRNGSPARVTLHDGEERQFQPGGDLGEQNAGVLVFAAGAARPDYVAWRDVERIDLARETVP
jgi:hypothetical protein